MRKRRRSAKVVLAGLLLLPLGAAGESKEPAVCAAVQARSAICKSLGATGALGYDAGSQGCADGGDGCHPAI